MEGWEGKQSIESKEQIRMQDVAYYLNAGGLGTRLESVLPKDEKRGITKALIDFGEKPIVSYHLDRAIQLDFGQIIIGAGHHKNISDFLSETESGRAGKFIVDLQSEQFGTGGDLIKAMRSQEKIQPYLLIQNVDTLLDIDEKAVLGQHNNLGSAATIVLTTKKGVPNEDAYYVDADKRVLYSAEANLKYKSKEPESGVDYRGSSTGMVLVNTELVTGFDWTEADGPLSLYSQMLGKWVQDGLVSAYSNGPRFFKDIGTPKTYQQLKRHPILETILKSRIKK